LRYALVEQTLRRQLDGMGPLRVLDVGGGDAADSAEAPRAGVPIRVVHGSLADLEPIGAYDVVLCHFVLQYLDDTVSDVARLVSVARRGGWFADLLRLELALHDREPFNRIGAYWHLLATRG